MLFSFLALLFFIFVKSSSQFNLDVHISNMINISFIIEPSIGMIRLRSPNPSLFLYLKIVQQKQKTLTISFEWINQFPITHLCINHSFFNHFVHRALHINRKCYNHWKYLWMALTWFSFLEQRIINETIKLKTHVSPKKLKSSNMDSCLMHKRTWGILPSLYDYAYLL